MKNLRLIVSILFSISAILLFVVLYGMELSDAWRGLSKPSDPIDTPEAYVATAVAGLVVAIVATALGLPIPDPSQGPREGGAKPSRARLFVDRLADVVTGTRDEKDWKTFLAVAYVGAYMLVGLAALLTWVLQDEHASSLLKTQALTWLGMMLASVRAFLTWNDGRTTAAPANTTGAARNSLRTQG